MITGTYNVNLGTVSLAAGSVPTHYQHTTQGVRVRSIGIALSGAAVNSATPVVVEIAIVGGATLGAVTLANGAVAGDGETATIDPPIWLPADSVVSVSVTTTATVAAGTAALTLGLYMG